MSDRFPLDDEGIWCQPVSSRNATSRPALFLDRDGVALEEVHYLHKVEETRLIAGAAGIIRQANQAGVLVVIVTNQAGIARGMYGWDEFDAVQKRMIDLLAAEGASVDAVYACPHHEKGEGQFHHPDHPARKPNPGMLLRAMDAFDVAKEKSWIVGDRTSDLQAGLNAGIAGGVHVLTGHGSREGERDEAMAVGTGSFTVHGIPSIADLAGLDLFKA